MSTFGKIVSFVIALVVLGIVIYMLYVYGYEYAVEEKKRQDCLTELRKICTDCQLIGIKDPKACPNSLTGNYLYCKELMGEKEEKITDCTKYIGKIE